MLGTTAMYFCITVKGHVVQRFPGEDSMDLYGYKKRGLKGYP